jgi:outer membrane protein TolC
LIAGAQASVGGAVVLLAIAGVARAEPTLTLDDAIRMARAHHPAVDSERAQAAAAEGRRQQALARLLPFLTGGVAYQPTTPNLVATPAQTRALLSSTGSDTVVDSAGMPTTITCRTPGVGDCAVIAPAPTSWALQNFWMADIGLSWTAWDWGHSINGYRGARNFLAAADVGVTTAERDVALQVALAFFGALAADQQVAVAEDAVKTYQAHLAQTRGLHDSGLRTGIDVATAESAEASAAIALSRARSTRQMVRDQLQVALGDDRPHDWRLVADPATFDWQPADDNLVRARFGALEDDAFSHRTELVQLRLQQNGLAAQTAAARAGYFPQLTLNIDPVWGGSAWSSLTGNLTVTVALGFAPGGMSPWLVHGQIREAEANLLVVEAQERAQRAAIRREAADARSAFSAARDELRLTQTLTEAAARQRSLAEGRYQSGVGNIIELYDALLGDVNARFQMVQARLAVAEARVQLRHALGEGD